MAGATVRFSIFGDPAGSTLSRDTAQTDVNGIATVTLTAGQAEKSLPVAATAVNAPDADFDVSVSKFDFVELDAQLAWPTASTLRALLYDDKSCAELPPSPSLPPPSRALSKPNATTATLQFVNLLSAPYALVGRAEDADGKLVGYGCVDVGAELAPPGSVSTVPVPLVADGAVGGRQLRAVVDAGAGSRRRTQALVGDVEAARRRLPVRRGAGAARRHGRDRATAIRRRADGCRPMSATSLDAQLQALLVAPPTAPANALPAIAADLVAIVPTATREVDADGDAGERDELQRPSTRSRRRHSRRARRSRRRTTSWRFGEPVIDVKDVPFSDDGTTRDDRRARLHARLAALWLQAFTDLSLTVRVTGPRLAGDPVAGERRSWRRRRTAARRAAPPSTISCAA